MSKSSRAARVWSLFSLLALLASCGPAPAPAATPAVPFPTAPRAAVTEIPRPSLPTATPRPTTVREAVPPETLRITVVYDNYAYQAGLETAWGFAALIEYQGQTLLFDTSGDPAILLHNMDLLGIDPASIQVMALSHLHGDHVDGLPGLEERRVYPPIYIPPSFDNRFRSRFGGHFELHDVAPGQELSPGIFSTGEMVHPAVRIREQALVISTTAGLVIVTGCAHPLHRRAGDLALCRGLWGRFAPSGGGAGDRRRVGRRTGPRPTNQPHPLRQPLVEQPAGVDH